jgi:hypothetical protein
VTVYGVTMVKDEADVIAGTLRHLADEGLELIVADNGSTDGTRDLLADLAHELPLDVLDDPDPAYYQSEKITRLADLAGARGATWVVPFDADELWLAPDRLSVVLAALPSGFNVARARLYNHFPTAIDPAGTDPFRTIEWRQSEPGALPKFAFRYRPGIVVHQGNHGVTIPGTQRETFGLEVRHFPCRSAEQFVRKARNGAAAYAATSLPPDVGAHWRGYGVILDRLGEDGLAEVFREHFWYLAPFEDGMVRDPAPYLRWR